MTPPEAKLFDTIEIVEQASAPSSGGGVAFPLFLFLIFKIILQVHILHQQNLFQKLY